MEKYISDIVNPKDIKINIDRIYDEHENKIESVKVEHIPTGIIVVELIENGQVVAYNKCIKRIESIIKYNKTRDFYKRYPDLFVESFMGVKLRLYQKIIIRAIGVFGRE